MAEVPPQPPEPTPTEPPEHGGLPLLDLTGLSPGQVVAANRYTRDQERAAQQRQDDAALALYQRYADALLEAIGMLPDHDPDQARAVLTTLADSPDARDRRDAAICLRDVLPVDHDFGVTLFEHLLRDPDATARTQAAQILSEVNAATASEAVRSQVLERRDELGLDERDVERLQHAYLQAEHGEGIYRLGEVVLAQLMARGDRPVPPPDAP